MQKLAQAWLQNKFNLPMELYVAAFEADPNLEDQDGSRFGLTWRLGRNCLLSNMTSFSGPGLFLDFSQQRAFTLLATVLFPPEKAPEAKTLFLGAKKWDRNLQLENLT